MVQKSVSVHLLFCVLLISFFAFGCKQDRGIFVEGTANYNGEPIASGRVLFVDEKDVPTMIPIVNGKFSGHLLPGEMTCRIWGEKIVKLEKPLILADMTTVTETSEPIVPAKYNIHSTLKRKISPQDRVLEFSLEK